MESERVFKLYGAGFSTREVARALQCSHPAILRVLHEARVPIRSRAEQTRLLLERKPELRQKFRENGKKAKGRRHSEQSLAKYRELGRERHEAKMQELTTRLPVPLLLQMYLTERRSIRDICDLTGLNLVQVQDLLDYYNIKTRSIQEAMKDNPKNFGKSRDFSAQDNEIRRIAAERRGSGRAMIVLGTHGDGYCPDMIEIYGDAIAVEVDNCGPGRKAFVEAKARRAGFQKVEWLPFPKPTT